MAVVISFLLREKLDSYWGAWYFMSYDHVSEAIGPVGRAVVPQLHRSPPPRKLVKSQIAGLHGQSFGFRRWGPECAFLPVPQWCWFGTTLLVWDHTLRTPLWKMEKNQNLVLFLVHPENQWALKLVAGTHWHACEQWVWFLISGTFLTGFRWCWKSKDWYSQGKAGFLSTRGFQ